MEEFQDIELPPSKTRRKQQAKAVEQLAEQLATMSANQFAHLQLADDLTREVEIARTTRGRGSQKRQVKHLAAVLRQREAELQQVLAQMQKLDQVAHSEKRQFHQLEQLRDRLCNLAGFDAAFRDMLEQFPQIDRNVIGRLARSVHQHGDKRASREIFRRLRDAAEQEE